MGVAGLRRAAARPRWWVVAAITAAVLVTQALAHRPDPAAEPGLRTAVQLLLSTDAGLLLGPDPRPGDTVDPGPARRAERAALVARIWSGPGAARRLAEVQGRPIGTRLVRFEAARWVDVDAYADRGGVVVVGHLAWRQVGGSWQPGPEQQWRIELDRGDPVGRQRGWTLRTVDTRPV